MRILFIITGLGMGGAECQVCNLADSLALKGNVVKIISLSPKLDTGVMPKQNNVDVCFLNMDKNPLRFITFYFNLRRVIKDFNPDVVHSHMFHSNIIARLIRITLDIPKLVCTAHSKNEGGNLRMLIYRLTNFLADINTNVSQEAVDEFIKRKAVKSNQMMVVQNGIDTEKFYNEIQFGNKIKNQLNIDKNMYIFLAVGRLTDAKDYPNLLNAFSIVHQQNQKTYLLIAGIGELETQLRTLCSELQLDNAVYFLGLRRDIPEIMNVADTYVMSSHFEGLPLVIGEAMACENIIVATDCGGIKEIVGNSGFIVPIRNSELLAEKMLYTISIPQEQRNKLGKNAREHIKQNYSLDAITEKWIKLYKD